MSESSTSDVGGLRPGIYEQIIDCVLEGELSRSDLEQITENLDPGDSHAYLSQFMSHILSQGLSALRGKEGSGDKLSRQIEVCNDIIRFLREKELVGAGERTISPFAKRLLALQEKHGRSFRNRPDSPLATACLLTGTRQDPSLVSQLKKEIETADRIDILCSFVKWTGIRILQEDLEKFAQQDGSRLRIITTSYMGATDIKAVEFLRSLPNTELKVSYDTRRTRLHAKAYLFHRDSAFDSAYVGSANLSHAALTDGLEWNVKISGYEQPFLFEKIASTFETYWFDKEFELYSENEKARLSDALASEHGDDFDSSFAVPLFELRPYMFQREILETIATERELHGRTKHLIVAATGTGKTMMVAFDFRDWCQAFKDRNENRAPRFLFIAHREELLKQAMYTFRAVLRDQNFGDLMVGDFKPSQFSQLFVSIQSYGAKSLQKEFESSYFDYLVVDEFHHSCAPTYDALLTHFKPKALIGLTATPERADGQDVTRYFDGHISAEVRLPGAINRKLLSPFQYFGVSDSIDYSQIKWRRGGYDRGELNNVLTGDAIRANRVAEVTGELVLDIRRARGLGFCVSKSHAEYMANVFNEKGIPATFLTADSPSATRNGVQKQLRDRVINFIFVVDLFNEGIDIPEIDTVLFLRPTESLTVFLQQLGRGLRIHDGKDCLTVLDFVGQAHRNFRYDVLFRSLLTSSGDSLEREIESGFPHLPAGCSITLERKSREYILENIRQSIATHKTALIQRISSFEEESGKAISLAGFLNYHRLESDEIYRRGCWSRLLLQAGILDTLSDPDEDVFCKALRRLQHIDDIDYILNVADWLKSPTELHLIEDELRQRHVTMFYFSFFPPAQEGPGILGLIDIVRNNPVIKIELQELLAYRITLIRHVSVDTNLSFLCPLRLHAQYSISEVRAALGQLTIERRTPFREGVLHMPHLPADVFFITLDKTDARYSPTTMYEDYAIDESNFHWQSQSTTSTASPTGKRYVCHEENSHAILLFVRERAKVRGRAMPFYFLGPAIYQSHRGEKPISFHWKLLHPMPADLQMCTERLAIL